MIYKLSPIMMSARRELTVKRIQTVDIIQKSIYLVRDQKTNGSNTCMHTSMMKCKSTISSHTYILTAANLTET